MIVKRPELLRALVEAAGHTHKSLAEATRKADGTPPSRAMIQGLVSGRKTTASEHLAASIAEVIGFRVDLVFMPETDHDGTGHPSRCDRKTRRTRRRQTRRDA